MKTSIYTIIQVFLAIVITVGVLAPAVTSAQSFRGESSEDTVCRFPSPAEDRIVNRIEAIKQNSIERRQFHQNNIAERREKFRQERNERKALWLTKRDEMLAKLGERQEGSRDAIDAFVAATAAARDTRDAAVQAAVDTYYTDLDGARASLADAILGLVDTYIADVQAAFDRAEADCESGVGKITIVQTLRSDIQLARQDFIDARLGINIRDTIEPIIAARRNAMQSAVTTFIAEIKAAVSALKDAL